MITAMRNEEQKELMQWLCRMEEIAVRSNVKTRLLDAIADCKRDLSSGLSGERKVPWRQRSGRRPQKCESAAGIPTRF